MMNCKEATQLLSEKLDRPLDTKEKVMLGVHTAMCSSCKQFGRQMEDIRSLAKQYSKGDQTDEKE
ncbi:zf-HC2 domain-containing protein [Marinomonas aquiplantarum]|uniref:Putative zinc finger protein n=1 Tax=Marinomonas aquiplantarum TaxID=491951 RepID=A0A366D9H0_9GAMM|nr:zf-HC2 domain-containing protein [Marinomonas aquiplantarum]RBO86094.1 putative zinc finger protein [Marinomonas aquiplantarum]